MSGNRQIDTTNANTLSVSGIGQPAFCERACPSPPSPSALISQHVGAGGGWGLHQCRSRAETRLVRVRGAKGPLAGIFRGKAGG